jgi:hypothetical protein
MTDAKKVSPNAVRVEFGAYCHPFTNPSVSVEGGVMVEVRLAFEVIRLRAEVDTLTRERDEARAERDAWELSSTNWQADCRVAQSHAHPRAAAMRTREDVLKEMLAACRIQTTMLDDLHFAMADHIAALEARTDTRVVTDAMVERAAQRWYPYFWQLASPDTQSGFLSAARVALTAALTPEDA